MDEGGSGIIAIQPQQRQSPYDKKQREADSVFSNHVDASRAKVRDLEAFGVPMGKQNARSLYRKTSKEQFETPNSNGRDSKKHTHGSGGANSGGKSGRGNSFEGR